MHKTLQLHEKYQYSYSSVTSLHPTKTFQTQSNQSVARLGIGWPGQKLVKGRRAESVGMNAHMEFCIQGMFVLLRRLALLLVAQGPKGGGNSCSVDRGSFIRAKSAGRPIASLPAGWCRCAVCRAQDPPKRKVGRFRNGGLVIAMGCPVQTRKTESWKIGYCPSALFSTFQLSGVNHNTDNNGCHKNNRNNNNSQGYPRPQGYMETLKDYQGTMEFCIKGFVGLFVTDPKHPSQHFASHLPLNPKPSMRSPEVIPHFWTSSRLGLQFKASCFGCNQQMKV